MVHNVCSEKNLKPQITPITQIYCRRKGLTIGTEQFVWSKSVGAETRCTTLSESVKSA
jgi:hypothetical protein